jgi:hypothetical protein
MLQLINNTGLHTVESTGITAFAKIQHDSPILLNKVRKIQLTKGVTAMVDNADYIWLNQYSWRVAFNKNKQPYAKSTIEGKDILMHRFILRLDAGDKRQGEHSDGNGLNNQRNNIRIATHGQNQCNKKGWAKSGLKGVYIEERASGNTYYRAVISHEGKKHELGTYPFTEEGKTEAAKAYDKEAIKLHGKFAKLNYPNDRPLSEIYNPIQL